MRIELVEVLWRFGKFPAAKLPQIANQELLKGFYGEATASIAAMYNPGYTEVRELFDKAIIEIKGKTLSSEEMAVIAICGIAQKEITIIEGGEILATLHNEFEASEELRIFKILSTEYSQYFARYYSLKGNSLRMLDLCKRRCEQDILKEAQNYFQMFK